MNLVQIQKQLSVSGFGKKQVVSLYSTDSLKEASLSKFLQRKLESQKAVELSEEVVKSHGLIPNREPDLKQDDNRQGSHRAR